MNSKLALHLRTEECFSSDSHSVLEELGAMHSPLTEEYATSLRLLLNFGRIQPALGDWGHISEVSLLRPLLHSSSVYVTILSSSHHHHHHHHG